MMALTLISILAHALLLVCSNHLLGCLVSAETRPFGLRLTGGQTEFEGRLEIEYRLNQWGSICDDRWDWPATFVVCNQLGLGPPLDHLFIFPTDFSIPIVYDNVVCHGNETRLVDCSHDGVGNHDCSHSEDVTIHCAPPIGDSDYAVETVSNLEPLDMFTLIYYETYWYTLCQSNWSLRDVDVLCHQLGFRQPNTKISFTMSVPPVFQSYECLGMYPVCRGTENHLRECEWFSAGSSSSPPYLLVNCDANILSFNSTEGTTDSRRLSPMLTVFLVLFGVVVLLILTCKLFQKVQCEAGSCECFESPTTHGQEQQAQIRVIAIRTLEEDDDLSLYTQHATEIQELPDDVPPSYDQYVTNPDLFRTFSEVRRSEGLDPNPQVEDSIDSPPPDYDSATFGFSVNSENESQSSFDTRL